jgi:hypothetical protein
MIGGMEDLLREGWLARLNFPGGALFNWLKMIRFAKDDFFH